MKTKHTLFIFLCIFGLISFQGQSQTITSFTKSNSAIASNAIYSIDIDSSNVVWIATDNGISSLNGDVFTNFDLSDNLAGLYSYGLDFEYGTGIANIWCGSKSGITKLDVDDLSTGIYTVANSDLLSDTIYASHVAANGLKLFGTPKGLCTFDNTNWDAIQIAGTLGEPTDLKTKTIKNIYAKSDGFIYMATSGGIARVTKTIDGFTRASTVYSPFNGIQSNNTTAVYVDAKDKRWYGTVAGLTSQIGADPKSGFGVYTTSTSNIPHNYVTSLLGDSSYNMWVGTRGGIAKYDGVNWQTWNTALGLPNDTVTSIAMDADKNVWVGTRGGLAKLNIHTATNKLLADDHFSVFPNPAGSFIEIALPETKTNSIYIYNINGTLIKRIELNSSASHQKNLRLTLDDYSNGIYWLKLQTDLGIYAKKFAVIK